MGTIYHKDINSYTLPNGETSVIDISVPKGKYIAYATTELGGTYSMRLFGWMRINNKIYGRSCIAANNGYTLQTIATFELSSESMVHMQLYKESTQEDFLVARLNLFIVKTG